MGAFEGLTKVSQRNLASPFTHQTENTDGGRYPTCNFLVRRNLAYFYPAYKIPFREDTDLAFSILALGYSIIFAPDLIVDHPPLNSNYSRPIILARRYYYDGLLARRFPQRYRLDLDVHQVLGFKIPQQLSVIGYDGIALGGYLDPPLTTLTFSIDASGREIVAMLLRRLKEPGLPVISKLASATLKLRGSEGPPT